MAYSSCCDRNNFVEKGFREIVEESKWVEKIGIRESGGTIEQAGETERCGEKKGAQIRAKKQLRSV